MIEIGNSELISVYLYAYKQTSLEQVIFLRTSVQYNSVGCCLTTVQITTIASNQRQKKRDAEEADKVEVAPGVTVASLRRFRTALIGPTQGLPKRRRLCH